MAVVVHHPRPVLVPLGLDAPGNALEGLQGAEDRLESFARRMTPQLDAAVDAVLDLAN